MVRFNLSVERMAWLWAAAVLAVLTLFFVATSASYLKMDILLVWFLSCVAIIFTSHRGVRRVDGRERIWFILIGIGTVILSFVNIPIGFGNPPYSIGDLSILIAGVGIIIFGSLGLRSFLLPVSFPLIAVLGFQLYELFIRHQYWIAAPLIPLTVSLTMGLLALLGIPAEAVGNHVIYRSIQGQTVNLAIVPDCTGIWSLGTFTIAVGLVLMSFPFVLSRMTYIYIVAGYCGTYVANILRILFIAITGYYYGPSSIVVETTHMHIGWVIFLTWMTVFWYLFFTRIVRPKQKELQLKDSDSRAAGQNNNMIPASDPEGENEVQQDRNI